MGVIVNFGLVSLLQLFAQINEFCPLCSLYYVKTVIQKISNIVFYMYWSPNFWHVLVSLGFQKIFLLSFRISQIKIERFCVVPPLLAPIIWRCSKRIFRSIFRTRIAEIVSLFSGDVTLCPSRLIHECGHKQRQWQLQFNVHDLKEYQLLHVLWCVQHLRKQSFLRPMVFMVFPIPWIGSIPVSGQSSKAQLLK